MGSTCENAEDERRYPRRATAIIAATEEGVPPPTPNELTQRRRVSQPTSQFTHIDHAHRTQVTPEFASKRRSGRRPSTSAPYSNDPAMPKVRQLLETSPNITGPEVAERTGVSLAKAYRLINAAKAHPDTTG
jgi:hypothetical protein